MLTKPIPAPIKDNNTVEVIQFTNLNDSEATMSAANTKNRHIKQCSEKGCKALTGLPSGKCFWHRPKK